MIRLSRRRIRQLVLTGLLLVCAPFSTTAVDVYQDPNEFLAEVFSDDVPKPSRFWLTKELKAGIRSILGYDLGVLRVRYWRRGDRTAWILDEIGKEQPITTGLVLAAGEIESVRVLIYRESRGWEVRYPAFTDQFRGATLKNAGRDFELDRGIDGISGATLSVHALTRLARLALLLDHHASS